MLVASDAKLAGVIGVADVVKETSREAVAELKKMGIEVIMLTRATIPVRRRSSPPRSG